MADERYAMTTLLDRKLDVCIEAYKNQSFDLTKALADYVCTIEQSDQLHSILENEILIEAKRLRDDIANTKDKRRLKKHQKEFLREEQNRSVRTNTEWRTYEAILKCSRVINAQDYLRLGKQSQISEQEQYYLDRYTSLCQIENNFEGVFGYFLEYEIYKNLPTRLATLHTIFIENLTKEDVVKLLFKPEDQSFTLSGKDVLILKGSQHTRQAQLLKTLSKEPFSIWETDDIRDDWDKTNPEGVTKKSPYIAARSINEKVFKETGISDFLIVNSIHQVSINSEYLE